MKQRLSALLLLAALACAIFIAPLSAAAAPTAQTAGVSIPVSTSGTNSLGQLINFVGSVNITRFAIRNGQLTAIGTLTGTATNTVTGVTQAVSQALAVPVIGASGSCTILDLTLGPIHLDVLGLVVDLNQVHLVITAQQGSGNLLGNLLCAVANLLNAGGPLTSLANLLNLILRQL